MRKKAGEKKNKGGAKQKFDFSDPQNILRIEGWARDGLDDKQIAVNIGYNETYFSELKSKFSELAEAIKRGRAPLDTIVESALLRRARGTTLNVEQAFKCKKVWRDENGNRCEEEIIKTVVLKQDVAPDVGAIAFWLKNRKPDIWNKQPIRIDATTNGKEIPARVLSVKEAKELISELENEL